MKKARTEMRKEGVRQDDFGSHVKVLRKVSAGARSRSRHVRPLGRVFAHFCACTEAQRLSRSSLASKLQVLALRLLVAKDESFAFGSASSVGRPGQPSPSELVDGFDDSTVNIKERRARGRGGSPRPDHPIRSDDPGMVQ